MQESKITGREKHPPHELTYTNANVIISTAPAILYSVTIGADGANADCQIYNGLSANDEQKMHLEALSGTTGNFKTTRGVAMKKGIYIVVNASTTKVSVEWLPLYEQK